MNASAADSAAYPARPGTSSATVTAITANPKFQELVRTRNALALVLSIVMMAIYLGFIFLVAFDKPLLATKFGGTTTSLGIVLGLVVIASAIILTGFYVVRANGRFDALNTALVREHGR